MSHARQRQQFWRGRRVTFLSPWMLLGLSALSLPVVIHLLSRPQTRSLKWAAMRFVPREAPPRRSRRWPEDWPLMLLRCAVLAAVVAAMSRWVLGSGAAGTSAALQGILVIDTTLSTASGKPTTLDLERQWARHCVENLPAGSRIGLWAVGGGGGGGGGAGAGGSPRATARRIIAEPTDDVPTVLQAIDELQPTGCGGDMATALRQAAQSVGPSGTVWALSDFQAATWPAQPRLQNTPAAAVVLVRCGGLPAANMAIVSVTAATPVAIDAVARFEIVVRNFGTTEQLNVPVTLRIDDPTGQSAAAPADQTVLDRIGPGQSRAVNLGCRISHAGQSLVSAAVPLDTLPQDDTRHLAVKAHKKLRLLLAESSRGTDVRSADGFYLAGLLSGGSLFDVQRVSTADIASGRASVEDVDALVVCGGAMLPALGPVMKYFSARGCGVLLFPGGREGPACADFGLAKAQPEVPSTHLAGQQPVHPITSRWIAQAETSLTQVTATRRWPLPTDGFASVVNWADGSPAVVAATMPQGGRVVVFGLSAQTITGDFPLRPGVFVPLVHEAARWAASGESEAASFTSGAPVTINLPATAAGKMVHVICRSATRDALLTRAVNQGGVCRAELSDALPLLPGAYTVEIDRQVEGDKHWLTIAPETSESDLSSTIDAATMWPGGRVVDAGSALTSAAPSPQTSGGQTELSRTWLIAALAGVLLETLWVLGRGKQPVRERP